MSLTSIKISKVIQSGLFADTYSMRLYRYVACIATFSIVTSKCRSDSALSFGIEEKVEIEIWI